MQTLTAYNNDPELKAGLLAEVHKHYLADQIIKGAYGKENGVWKGCAVGCTIRSYNIIRGETNNTSDHKVFEKFGIPQLLARLCDRIFEGLPNTHNTQWPERFLSAINPGADLNSVWPKFARWLMIDPEHGVMRFAKSEHTKESIQGVADLYAHGWLSRENADVAYTAAAAASAYAAAAFDFAAAAAAYAAYAAAYAAYAAVEYAADYAAEYAASAAVNAAAASDARFKAYISQANKLEELLKAA